MLASRLPTTLLLFLIAMAVLAWPREAMAQWYLAGYFGTTDTRPADVAIDVPALDLSIVFQDVEFEGRPFDAPLYYGWRVGHIFGDGGGWRSGVEVEFIHLKVYAETAASYAVTGRIAGVAAGGRLPMDVVAERYAMSHGLNFLVGNVVIRRALSGRLAFAGRAGLGITIPHAESTILGTPREQYEYGGLGAHAAAGLDFRVAGPLGALVEYKLTWARPEIDVDRGTGKTTSLTHHLAFGFRLGK